MKESERTKSNVEPLDPGHPVDEVQSGARVAADVADDEEDVARGTADGCVEGAL